MSKTTGRACEAYGDMFLRRFIDFVTFSHHDRTQPFEIMATILNDEEIKKLIGKVILDGDVSCIKPNSYALRLGLHGEFLNSGKEFKLGTTKKGIKVQPGHSVALTAFETIDFSRETVRKIYPDHDLHAFISPLTDLSREGIVAPTTQVDVGYHGTLNWTITNTSNDVRNFLIEEKLFRLTIFKLAPGETPTNPYKGDYQSKTGYIRSQRRGAPVGMKESQWEDSCIEGGPEALLDNLIKSGYPWNLLGQRLQLIGGQFETVTNEFGDIKRAIEGLDKESKKLPTQLDEIIDRRTSELHFQWSASALTAVGVLAGLALAIATCDWAVKFLKSYGPVIGILIIIISVVAKILIPKIPRKKKP
jgi:deoxycytidine triphosphate deaminase